MPLTRTEFEEVCRGACAYCHNGSEPKFRADTKEYFHDYVKGAQFSHVYCLATGIRNFYADKEFADG